MQRSNFYPTRNSCFNTVTNFCIFVTLKEESLVNMYELEMNSQLVRHVVYKYMSTCQTAQFTMTSYDLTTSISRHRSHGNGKCGHYFFASVCSGCHADTMLASCHIKWPAIMSFDQQL